MVSVIKLLMLPQIVDARFGSVSVKKPVTLLHRSLKNCGISSLINGKILLFHMLLAQVGIDTKKIVSDLPERTYFNESMTVRETIDFFEDFYEDFSRAKAEDMLARLHVDTGRKLKTLSKGNKEKVQLVLVMSRHARLYLLDEPIGGVDPATRDYILDTIVSNYNQDSTVLISTHLIADIEKVLDEFVFINMGNLVMHSSADEVRAERGKSIDELFREVFRC